MRVRCRLSRLFGSTTLSRHPPIRATCESSLTQGPQQSSRWQSRTTQFRFLFRPACVYRAHAKEVSGCFLWTEGVPTLGFRHAASSYSSIKPPSRSRRTSRVLRIDRDRGVGNLDAAQATYSEWHLSPTTGRPRSASGSLPSSMRRAVKVPSGGWKRVRIGSVIGGETRGSEGDQRDAKGQVRPHIDPSPQVEKPPQSVLKNVGGRPRPWVRIPPLPPSTQQFDGPEEVGCWCPGRGGAVWGPWLERRPLDVEALLRVVGPQ